MQSCEYYSAVEAAKFYCTLFFDGSLIRDPEVNKKSHRKTKIDVSGKGFTTLESWIKASRMLHWLKYGRSWNCQSHAWFVWGSWCEIFSHTEFIKVATSYFQFHSLMLCYFTCICAIFNVSSMSELKQLLHEHNQNRVVFFSFHSWKQDTLVMTSIVVQKREDASGNFIAVNLLLFGNNFCHLMFFCQDVVGYNCQESCKNTEPAFQTL